MKPPLRPFMALALVGAFAVAASRAPSAAESPSPRLPEALRRSLTFAATFDHGLDADVAKGDAKLYSAGDYSRKGAVIGLTDAAIERASGRVGQALRFRRENRRILFFQGKGNVPYEHASAWSGTFSYFLKLDPEKDLPPDYVDPLQVTDKAWNNAAFWNDFTKDDRPRKFRLGTLANLKVWNPDGKDFDKLPDAEKPAVVVNNPPFSSERWTHVAITFERYNTGLPNGVARLYLDGKLQGEVKARNQRYTWDPEKVALYLGIGYVGLMDEVLVFDRALSVREVQRLSGRGD